MFNNVLPSAEPDAFISIEPVTIISDNVLCEIPAPEVKMPEPPPPPPDSSEVTLVENEPESVPILSEKPPDAAANEPVIPVAVNELPPPPEPNPNATAEAEAQFSGVSLDTEAANLIEQQQAYQASARILQTARELFDTLLQSV